MFSVTAPLYGGQFTQHGEKCEFYISQLFSPTMDYPWYVDESRVMSLFIALPSDVSEGANIDCQKEGTLQIHQPTDEFFGNRDDLSCAINITDFGKVGEPVRGYFSAVLENDTHERLDVSGSFDIIRGSGNVYGE